MLVYDNGEKIAEGSLVSMETATKGGILSNIGVADEDRWLFILATAILIALIIFISYLLKRKREKARIRARARNKRRIKQHERERERDPFGVNKR